MKIIDLTHIIKPDMPVFPGTETPTILPTNTIAKDGFAETKLSMYSHIGTHIDAPSHMQAEADSLEQLDISHFVGKAVILDFTEINGSEITKETLLKHKDKLKELDFIILKTGWSKYWGSDKYFGKFPYLTEEAAEWLVSLKLKGIGIDAISIDDMETRTFPIHYMLFKNNMIVIENLTNLESAGEEIFIFSCLPLKYENADGSPVRAIAIKDTF